MRITTSGPVFVPFLVCFQIALLSGLTAQTIGCTESGSASDDCGKDYCVTSEGQISVFPEEVTFDSTGIGDTAVRFVTVSNVGRGELVIARVSVDSRGEELGVEGNDLPLTLQPGQERVFEVTYAPVDCRADRGSLVIRSNDRDKPEMNIPLVPQALTGQITVHPSPVEFGRVPAGTTRTSEVLITNAGICALDVNDLFLGGSPDFSLLVDEDGEFLDPDDTLPFAIESGEHKRVEITYTPSNDGFDEGLLQIRSDDAANRTVSVPVVGNGKQPCIVVSDETGIDFGQRFIGEEHGRTVSVTNCSQRQDLVIHGVSLGEHFELDGLDRFELGGLPDLSEPWTLPPNSTESFLLTFAPILYSTANHPSCEDDEGCEIPDGAVLVIESNDSVKSPLHIEIRGVGANNHCPSTVARARILGGNGFWDTAVDACPLETLELDGRDSADAEGAIASYQWEVSQRPGGSTAQLMPTGEVPNPTFFLDLAGQYRFRLRVFDDDGMEGCDSAEIVAIVTPCEAVHIQCVWETPGDPNRLDTGAGTGSDVDCHLLHPNGGWDRAPWDCHWKNRAPNWGNSGSTSDDPSLDIDDTDGWGPENINLDEPEGTVTAPRVYSIGAFYFSDHGYGPSDVTVRVFLDGSLAFEQTLRGLEDRQFWDVARIEWPSREVERVHRLYPSGFPY